jgi:peptide/nickel transport system substrate-binding protein
VSKLTGRAVALVVATALAASACNAPAAVSPSAGAPSAGASATPSSSAAPSPETLGRVVLRHGADFDTLDMHKSRLGPNTGQIGAALYDRLVAVGPGGTVVPYLAKSWVIEPGSITFEVRTDAVCADGTPVTAQVIADSLSRTFDPATEALIPQAAFGRGPYTVTLVDATHVNVKIEGSVTTNIVAPFAGGAFNIYCPAGLEAGADFETTAFGSGPYTLVSVTKGDSIVLQLRPEWTWGPESSTAATLPTELVIKFVANDTTAANLLVTGELDIATINGPDITRLAADASLNSIVGSSPWATMLWFNESPDRPGADPAVREALMSVIDREAWNVGANGGFGTLATSIIAPDVECFDDSVAALIPTGDLDAVRAILEGAGYARGGDGIYAKDGKPLALRLIGHLSEGSGPDYVTERWSELGVSVTLAKTNDADWINSFVAGDFDAATHTNITATDAPLQVIDSFVGASADLLPPNGGAVGRIVNATAAAASLTAKTTTDATERCDAIKELQQALVGDHDILPLTNKELHWFTRGLEVQPALAQGLELYTIRRAG